MTLHNVLDKPVSLAEQKWPVGVTPLVSILCITYNHEAFIEDCIKGFLMQETTFPVEIIVHDDDSSDSTQGIVRWYHNQYPNLFRPVFQSKNRYSRGDRPVLLAWPFASGRFVAICEGDDYWIDRNKLQSQVDMLREHPPKNLCVHDAHVIDQYGAFSEYRFPSRGESPNIIDYKEIFATEGQFAPTSSMMIRRGIIRTLPDFFRRVPVGDFFIEALTGAHGVCYLPRKMSVYRRAVPGSWSSIVLQDADKKIVHYEKMLLSLHELNEYFNWEYYNMIILKRQAIDRRLAFAYLGKGDIFRSLRHFISFIRVGHDRARATLNYFESLVLVLGKKLLPWVEKRQTPVR